MLGRLGKSFAGGRYFALAVAILLLPAAALAGISAQGISAQGISAQGISAQGISAQGISAQGISAQGISAQGISAQGISAQGISAQGISAQGISAQGISAQGVSIMGTDLVAADMKGVDIDSVELRGTTSDSGVEAVELTANPGMSTGAGSYLSVGGASAVGHYATAHLVDVNGAPAEDLDLYIAGERPDPVPNLLHRADAQVNDDVTLYEVFFFSKWSGQWASLCPYHDATGGATAMAIAEDPMNPGKFMFACTATGVAAKCARIWGFRPWKTGTSWFFDDGVGDWVERDFDFKPFYDACKVAARASYCQDRQSFTRNGTLVDLFDTRQLIWPNAIENPFGALDDDSRWMLAQEYFVSFDNLSSDPSLRVTGLQRTRYRDLTPDSNCAAYATIDRLEHDDFEDSKWANPLTGTPRIQVFSGNYCTHNEAEIGEALPWDCSPCTTAVCKTNPECCSMDPTLPQPVWNAACVAAKNAVCQDGGTPWPLGRVWPRDVGPSTEADQKYLIGPGGAVARVDGVSAGGTSATVTGWACDPEWPGTVTRVEIYGGAPREHGGVLLGEVYAGAALANPLAREVAVACDGPGFATARHGFSFTLPPGTTGNVFVYGLDTGTPDGPSSPPTLLRNGIVHVPTCAHSEHVAGEALDSACSACATSICAKEGLGGCCATAWSDECAAEAETCEPAVTSAVANGRAFAQVLTGWIEAPETGPYVFAAGAEPSRVFVNGQKLVDWWDGPGATSGGISLMKGAKYAIRWDRFHASTPGSPTDQGLTWQLPGTVTQATIPASALYRVAPGTGTGLEATYYDALGFAGAAVTRLDASVDLSNATVLPAGITAPYSVIWDGEIVPLYTESYTFTVVAAGNASLEVAGASLPPPAPPAPPVAPGCPHDICAIGPKLAASTTTVEACDPCIDQVCAQDPYCCDGGYLSYYSTEPEWDAKCVAEVGALCGVSCKNPLPTTTTRHRSMAPVALQAGVRYHVRLKLEAGTPDLTTQLLWASPRQSREVVPTGALSPARAREDRGSGLNVVSFATKQNGTKPDLDTPLAAGVAPDLSLLPPAGADGLPITPVLAARDDAALGVPSAPTLVTPRYGAEVFSPAPSVGVKGFGGFIGGSVLAHVEGTAIDVVLPVTASGGFGGAIPVPAYGNWTLKLTQRSYAAAPCVSPPALFCKDSASVKWNVKVSPVAPAVPTPPLITSPRDPTASPNPANDTFAVTGRGNPGTYTVCDLGGGSTLTPTVTANGNGIINDSVQLSNGAGDPTKGWHKLVFTKGACGGAGGSAPVFVSVGIRPPTVEFPRTGAKIDCDPNAPDPSHIDVKGSVPYPETRFGRLRVYEETGRNGLSLVRKDMGVDQNPQPDGSFRFQGSMNLTPGKHLIYFFQAPDPPANATPDEIDAHFRAFASIADTPKSHIEITVPPPRLEFPIRGQLVVTTSPVTLQALDCVPGQVSGPGCSLPFADVNVRVGKRLFTARADQTGRWHMNLDVTPGWHPMRISQVVDSDAGGGWQEGCPGDETVVGVVQGDPKQRPTIKVPDLGPVPATSPAGAKVGYDVSAFTVTGAPAQVDCVPRSGATFRIGKTPVFCTAVDPDTHAVGLGGFIVEVVDGPPVVKVPKRLVAEATSSLGALVSWKAEADDAVSGPLPIECVPSSPALFAVDEERFVSCSATDGAGTMTTEQFPVLVRDTTAPTMCALPDLRVLASGPGGGAVRFKTCASDLVDGDVPVTCDHPSGSFFPVGKTLVTCSAIDRHQNAAPQKTFVVDVGDSTPPVLKLPGTIQVIAANKAGAKVGYSVTATDDTDPNPVVVCAPKSGSVFPLGPTTVNCTATDVWGNQSKGSFVVRVVVAWGGFLAPINNNGTSVFLRPLPVPVRIALTDGSLGITDLTARLFLARLDANGKPGPEQAAAGLPPGLGNLFIYNPLLREYDLLLDIHALAAGAWQLRADLGDGVAHTVKVTLR
jgi:hypothetical protein